MKAILQSLYHMRYVIGTATLVTIGTQYIAGKVLIKQVFGEDGNGGQMLKIVTMLTDEEIASLKATRRLRWHLPLERSLHEYIDGISDQELNKYGIKTEQEQYIEYQKRPPHDKYL